MNVEVFEQREMVDSGETENAAEVMALVERLGLEGQRQFIGTSGERLWYRKMTRQELNVYGTLLSAKSELKKFNECPVPLRVLQVAAHAETVLDRLEVWHQNNADVKDPLLVGIKGSEWSGERFILARWGDVLLPFDELVSKARLLALVKARVKIAENRAKFEAAAASFEQHVDAFVAGEAQTLVPSALL